MRNKTVVVTGSNGFVGQHLVKYLAACESGYHVIATSRAPRAWNHPNVTEVQVPNLTNSLDWRPLLSRCDAIIHLAGLAHTVADEDRYEQVNVGLTTSLTQAARDCGTRQFIYISSIAAQSGSYSEQELSEGDAPKPTSAYGRSKLAAENVVRASGVPFTVLRPVAMYGDGEKGNFALLRTCARLRLPLPFGRLTAPRSVLSVHNFNSAVDFVLTDSRSIGETFIVSDPAVLSVAAMITAHRAAAGRPPRLLEVPEALLRTLLKCVGRELMWQRLGCPLIAPSSKLLEMGWKPARSSFFPYEAPDKVCSLGSGLN